MKTVEVKEKQWGRFCQQLEQFCRGAAVNIELESEPGNKHAIAREMPLRSVMLEQEPCNTNLVIEAGLPDQKPVRHVVIDPIHVRLRNHDGSDRYHRLEISAENGITTVELHPGLNEALVQTLEV